MCYPAGVPLVRQRLRELAAHNRRWLLLQEPAVVETRTAVNMHAAERGGSGGATRRCLCSPSRHPGSFRCRQHHAEYVWGGGRIVRRNRSSN